jgi:ABC-type multidrug transport system ATPase subunit/DNA-binding beta-propeller fold protein YncE
MSEKLWVFENVVLDGMSLPRLNHLSFKINKGVSAILGESGAGKSSLVNLLTRFESPSTGIIEFTPSASSKRLPLFWVPQDDGLWPQLSVKEHLEAVVPDGKKSETKTVVQELLEKFDLDGLHDRKPENLSQGERSRLSVARALASGAEVIVMDEPLAHVDSRSSNHYWDSIQEYLKKNDSSLVFASHMSETVLRESEFCFCMDQGEIIYQGDTEDLYDNPSSEKVAWFLGPVNWFDSKESEFWLDDCSGNSKSIRPGKISVVEDESADFTLKGSRFIGTHSEVTLTDEKVNSEKTFYMQTDCRAIQVGKKVRLSVLSLLLMFFSITGCEKTEFPELPVKEVDIWMLPVKGKSIPTPRSMTVSEDGELLILDDAGRVLVYDLEGKLLRQWDMPASDVGNPEGISVLPDKRVVVADTHYHRIVFFDLQGKVLEMIGKEGTGPREFIYPVAVTHDDKGNIYVAEYGYNDRLQKFDSKGHFLLEMGKPGTAEGEFQRMSGLVWLDGFLYISDAINNRIQKFSDDGYFIEIYDLSDYGTKLDYPYDIALAPEGGFWIVEYGSGYLTRISLEGKLMGRFGKSGSGLNELTTPWGLTSTKDGRVFIADTGNRRVMEINLEKN